MRIVWTQGQATADDVRTALARDKPLKDSTVRTVLRRLEQKGYVSHVVSGRTYVYAPKVDSMRAAADAVRGIIDRFCAGSVETLLVGMVDSELLAADKLRELADRIDASEAGAKPSPRKRGRTR
jgi:predicted transcriptional regulator